MFCQKCGKEIEDGGKFCPYCGAKNMVVPKQEKQEKPVKEGKRKKKIPVVIAAILVVVVLGMIIFADDDSSSSEQLIALVQNGYLGNYDTVTIRDLLKYVDENAEWNAGKAVEGEHYIVEYKGDDIAIQFSVNGLEEETFRVSGIDVAGMDGSNMKAYDYKVYLDNLYLLYANAYPEKGLHIDTSTSNDTLEGHIGPIKAVKGSENAPLSIEDMKDLSIYVDYTEDKLIQELGYEKNEYGVYPEETHMNFYFIDGKMYAITLNKPEDVGISLCGVTVQDSIEDADAILKGKGFIREGSFDSNQLARDGSLDAIEGTVISYIESATGYSYYIYTDANNSITSLSYGLEAEDTPDEKADENALLEEFITLICSYSDPPDLDEDMLEEYFKGEFDSWLNGGGYANVTIDTDGHLVIPDHTAEYVGTWWDTYSQRCNMEISSYDGIYYTIDINWGSSAWDNTHWSFYGTYDEMTDGIHYYGSRIEEYYSDNGEVQETYAYSDGEGYIWIGDDGMLYWNDYIEQQGADCSFEKSEM